MKKKKLVLDFIALAAVGVLVFLDQWTKSLVTKFLEPDHSEVVVWKGVFKIISHKNTGAVWGIMSDKTDFLAYFTLVVLAGVIWFYFKLSWDMKRFRVLKILCIFLVGGAIGNLIDRLVLHYVVDFLYFELIDFPVFNVADCYITVAEFLTVFLLIFYYKDEDFKQIWPKKS